MPSTKTVWGIDVGQCALKALKLQWRDDRVRALGFDVIEHGKVLSQPDADEQALIRSALSKFLNRNSIKGSTVVISVPGQASFTRFIKLPPVEMRKIPEIVRYEARQQIPFDLDDVVWDYQTISSASAGPREVEVGIFAMKRDIVADYVSDYLAMKIEPDIVQMAPVALYNFLRHEYAGAGGTILIDVGAENTNLVVADGDRVWIRNVPLGGNNFTAALCKEFRLQFAKAENLKRHAAESKHARQVFQAMRPVFGDLLTEIQRSIGYYTSLHRDSRVERLLALGNAFRLPGLAKFLSQNLGIEVEKIEAFPSLADSEVAAAPMFRKNVLSFGVAYGLALQGVGVASIATSLLPPEIHSTKVLRKKRPFFIAAGAAVLGAVFAFAYDQSATYSELAGVGNEPARLKKQVAKVQNENNAQRARFDEQKDALVGEQRKISRLEGLVETQDYAYRVLQTLLDKKVWPRDPRWAEYDPWTDTPPYTSLDIIEMLDVRMHYVPDVREFSENAKKAGAGKVTVIGHEETVPPEGQEREGETGQPAPVAEKVPGLLIEVQGITPKTGMDAQRFVNDTLIAGMKACKRTIRLQTPVGIEVLASMPLQGVFRYRREYSDYVAKASTKKEEQAEEGGQPKIPRDDNFWFTAQWVVDFGPLKEWQRKDVFVDLCQLAAEADLDSPSKLAPGKATGAEAVGLTRIEEKLEALSRAWLIGRERLGEIAVEGEVKSWPRERTPPAP